MMMGRSVRLLAAAFILAAASSTVAPVRAQDAPPPGDAANGKKLYLATGCFECHGRTGQGGAFNGPAPILAKTQLPYEAFVQQLRSPSNDMPTYSMTVMSDKDTADIFAFLQSLSGPMEANAMPQILKH
jgi:mono/diheme cytochrome c family protein